MIRAKKTCATPSIPSLAALFPPELPRARGSAIRTTFCTGAAAFACLSTPGVHAQEVYATAGSLGVGAGVALPLTSWLGVHAELEGFGFSKRINIDGGEYDGHIGLLQGGLYLDLFPLSGSGFRVTAGALINNDDVKASAVETSDGQFKVGSNYVPAIGPAPSVKATFPHVMPYIGIGYGHKPVSKGFGLTFDFGAAYGQPKSQYYVPAVYNEIVSQADINQEESEITSKINKFKWYPVIQFGVSYRF